MRKLIAVIAIFVSCGTLFTYGQSATVAIGAWREHIPFSNAIDVAESNDGTIFCASTFGVFSYTQSDGELNTFTRLKELSDQEVAEIEFDKQTGVLVIAYANSNIDILYPDKTVVNLPDIKTKNIVGGKHINAIMFINELAYLTCDFGIVVVDIARREIKDTYYIAPNGVQLIIHDAAYNGTDMIAATDNGVYRANFNDPNIYNYTGWVKDTILTEPNANYTSCAAFQGEFYVGKTITPWGGDTILVFRNNQWVKAFIDVEGAFVNADENYVYYSNYYQVAAYDANGNEVRDINITMYNNAEPRKGFLDSQNNFWIADFKNGLVVRRNDNSIAEYHPNGPSSDAGWMCASRNGVLWVSTGVITGDAAEGFAYGIFRFSDNEWQSYDCTNDAIYQSICSYGWRATNYVAIDPSDPNHAFIASWGSGVLEYRKEGGVAKYNAYNSTLHTLAGDTSKCNVGGVEFDQDGNLWAITSGNSRAISVRRPNGVWQDFVIPVSSITGYSLYNMVVDDYGQKWFCARATPNGQGVCVFKERDLSDPNGASFRQLTDDVGNGALPDMYVRSIAKDKDGSIWLGTNKGVGVIYNPGNVFGGGSGSFDAQRIIIQQDGYNQYLLETEFVSAIAIDGANRKWFGTYAGGAFLMSADGQTQLLSFNTTNSPLPSNSINSIAIDDQTGEVFFATDKGIISYRGDATEGGEQCNNYYVYPNPVRSEYRGPIAIKGLPANSDVKIADVAGNVVYHTKANGGQAIWNGNNFSGERAKTGVYIVYITNDDGSAVCTTKMLFGN